MANVHTTSIPEIYTVRQVLAAIALVLCIGAGHAAPPFVVGDESIAVGERRSFFLSVPAGEGDEGTTIPVTVIRGAAPGPVLALIAGTHGYEYPPITALQNLRMALDPNALRGTVLMVHVANVPAFLGRTIYVSPVDGKNLNRVYPGDLAGTLSDRIAAIITAEVIERADYLIDLHAGDGNEALRPYVYMPETGDADFDHAARGLALAFGLDTIVIDRAPVAAPDATVLTDMTAISRGIPAITTETGLLGGNELQLVQLAERGVRNVLRHLDMLDGDVEPNDAVVWLEDFSVVRSPATGVFRSLVEEGWVVAEGARLGTVHDLFGVRVAEVIAPFTGVVNYVVATPPISEGEPTAMISRLADAP